MDTLKPFPAVHITDWPGGLKTVEEAAEAIGISGDRLLWLADGRYVPHFRIDGGKPFFKIPELKKWAATNLLEYVPARELPSPVRITIDPPKADYRNVPNSLRQVAGLRELTNELYRSGIYFLCLENELVYVGQSVNVIGRITSHVASKNFDRVFFLAWPPDDLTRIEAALIRALKPKLNGVVPSSKTEHDQQIMASIIIEKIEALDGIDRKEG